MLERGRASACDSGVGLWRGRGGRGCVARCARAGSRVVHVWSTCGARVEHVCVYVYVYVCVYVCGVCVRCVACSCGVRVRRALAACACGARACIVRACARVPPRAPPSWLRVAPSSSAARPAPRSPARASAAPRQSEPRATSR
eukprot:6356872-Prymnesium_polylepis.1